MNRSGGTPVYPEDMSPGYVVRAGPNNGFAIAVLVISIVAIVVCIVIVFVVKPCPGKSGAVALEPGAAVTGAAAATTVHEPDSAAALDRLIGSGDSVVTFYAKWCGHCQATVPEVRKAADDMGRTGAKVVMVDGDKLTPEDLKRHGIQGYPTIKYVHDGKPTAEYAGNRKAPSFVDFAQKHAGGAGASGAATGAAAVHEAGSATELDGLLGDGSSIVMFHAGWCPHCAQTLPAFKSAAADMAAAAPGTKIVTAEDVKTREALAKHGVKGFPTILHIKDGKATEYAGNRTAASFVDFAKQQR